MKKINHNGITFQDSISFSYAKPAKEFSIISKIIVILLGVTGTTFTFTSFFKFPFSGAVLIFWMGVFIAIFGFIFQHKEYMKYTMPLTFTVYGLGVFIYWQDIADGFICAYNNSIDLILLHMDLSLYPYELESSYRINERYVITIFLSFCIFIVTAAVCYSVFYKPNIFLIIITTVLPIGCFMYMGIVPNYLAFIALMAFWTTMIALSYATRHIKHGTKKKAVTDFVKSKRKNIYHMSNPKKIAIGNMGVAIALFCLIIFVGSNIAFLISGGAHVDKAAVIRKDIAAKMDNFSFDDFVRRVDSNIVNKEELGNKDSQVFKNITMLKAELNYSSDAIYLKGYVGSTYTGDGWTNLSDSEYKEYTKMLNDFDKNVIIQNLNSDYWKMISDQQIISAPLNKISITNVADEVRFLYAPYNTVYPQNDDVTYKYDSYVMKKNSEKYDVSFYNADYEFNINNQINYSNPLGEEYSKYVHDVYTKLPEGKLSKIKEMFKDSKGDDLQSTTQTISQFLNENAVYTLTPGKTPRGEDFVEYFLYENHKGYCTYFASAATVMLRAAGYPARYVSGYTIQPSDFPENDPAKVFSINVKDTRAHAWTEVYVDNYGWVPLDFTPISYLDNAAPVENSNDQSTAETTAVSDVTDQEVTTQASETQQGTETTIDSSQPSIETTSPSEQNDNINSSPSPEQTLPKKYTPPKKPMKPAEKRNLLVISTIAIIVIFGFILNIRRKINIKKKRQGFYSDDVNRDIVNLYGYFNQLLDFAGEDRIDEKRHKIIDELAIEAKFSNHALKREQFDELLDFTDRLALCIFSSRKVMELFEMAFVRNLY